MDGDFPSFLNGPVLGVDKYGSTYSREKIPGSPPDPYPYLKELFDRAEKPADSVYVAPEDIGMLANARDVFGMNVIVSDLVTPGTVILANAPALKWDPGSLDVGPEPYAMNFDQNLSRMRSEMMSRAALAGPRNLIRISGIDSGGDVTDREQRQWAERWKRRQPRLLPMKAEDGSRASAPRWGLDYRTTFRTRREAIRAIRKGRV